MAKKLTKRIGFEELGGALFELAKKESEEIVTRSIIGFSKAKNDIITAGGHALKGFAVKGLASLTEIDAVETVTDFYAGAKYLQAGYNGVKGYNKFVEGYTNATDADVEEARKNMGININDDDDDEE